jgi:branched-chain amino acid transport system ATP-binding protein
MALLEIDDCALSFGGLTAVDGVSLAVDVGELIGLIGPNGAGKTTVFNLITGVYAPERGTIRLADRSIAGLAPARINRLGVARTFQGVRLFPTLTAYENVLAGYGPRAADLLGTVVGTAAADAAHERVAAECHALLRMLDLERHAEVPARALPYGAQRRLEIARALATAPKLLLLDEPAAGTTPAEKIELVERIRWLRTSLGLGILIIEHDMKMIMEMCDRITVLDHGECIAAGPPEQVRADPAVIAAYLGEQRT